MTHLFGHAAALMVLAAVLWLPGRIAVERWLGPRELGRLRPLARICIGLAFWIAALFALAAVGQLHRTAVVVVAAAVAPPPLAPRRRARRPAKRRRRCRPPARIAVLVGAALAAVLTPLFLLALSPVVSWDADVYHLTVPRLYLAHEGFRPIAFNVYSNWPLAIELLFAMAMLVQDFILAKLVHFGFGLLTLAAIYTGCRVYVRRDGKTCGWMAMALFLANPVVAHEFHIAYIDLAHAFFLTAGFLFMLRAAGKAADAPRALLLAGLCGGVMAGIKLNGVVGAAILATLYLPRLARASRAGELPAAARGFGLRFVLPVAGLWLPWLVKSAWATGNPIYPFVFGGPHWSPELSAAFAAWHRGIGMGREPLDWLLLPVRAILLGGGGYARFGAAVGSFWILLLPLAVWAAWAPGRTLIRRCLWVAGLYFLLWAASSQQTRLLVPVLPLLAIAGAAAIVDLLGRLRSAIAGKALGRYQTDEGDLRRSAIHPVYDFIDRSLPGGARLLFLNTNHGFFCEREYIADSFFEASQISDWLRPAGDVAELRGLLAAEGITHVLIRHVARGVAYPAVLLEMLQDPARAEEIYRSPDGRFSVVELEAAE